MELKKSEGFSGSAHTKADEKRKRIRVFENFWKNVSGEKIRANWPALHGRIQAKHLAVVLLFAVAFAGGQAAAWLAEPESTAVSAEGSWGLSFQEEGKAPAANATREELAQFDAWYAGNTVDKVIYLTFDCGYENGNTPAILDALKKHQVPATFFVVGNFVSDNPELVKQMLAQGHTVGNHTSHHPDMSKISDLASFQKEITELEDVFREVTGTEISKYYRPPQGKYSESNLNMAQQLGYQTFFWSLAYVDWYENDQPTKEEAFEKLLGRIHPGAVVLLHNTSSTNGAILDELLTKWEEMGYTFGKLENIN